MDKSMLPSGTINASTLRIEGGYMCGWDGGTNTMYPYPEPWFHFEPYFQGTEPEKSLDETGQPFKYTTVAAIPAATTKECKDEVD